MSLYFLHVEDCVIRECQTVQRFRQLQYFCDRCVHLCERFMDSLVTILLKKDCKLLYHQTFVASHRFLTCRTGTEEVRDMAGYPCQKGVLIATNENLATDTLVALKLLILVSPPVLKSPVPCTLALYNSPTPSLDLRQLVTEYLNLVKDLVRYCFRELATASIVQWRNVQIMWSSPQMREENVVKIRSRTLEQCQRPTAGIPGSEG